MEIVLFIVVHCYVLAGILRVLRNKCEYPARLVIAGMIGLVVWLIGNELDIGEIAIAIASVIAVVLATTAYEFDAVFDRLFVMVFGVLVLTGAYAVVCVVEPMLFGDKYRLISFVLIEVFVYYGVRFILTYIYKIVKREQEQQIIMQQLDNYKNELLVMHVYEADLRGLRHDLKNHLNVLADMIVQDKKQDALAYINNMYEISNGNKKRINSGNFEIDSIINAKLNLMEQKKISYDYSVTVPDYLDISGVDLIIILGNLLDNAIRECECLKDRSEQTPNIRIAIDYSRGALSVRIGNKCVNDGRDYYYSSSDSQALNLPESTKKDKQNHGLGLKNVLISVKKYDGYIEIIKKQGEFMVEIII